MKRRLVKCSFLEILGILQKFWRFLYIQFVGLNMEAMQLGLMKDFFVKRSQNHWKVQNFVVGKVLQLTKVVSFECAYEIRVK